MLSCNISHNSPIAQPHFKVLVYLKISITNMNGAHFLGAFAILALSSSFALAFDPSPLQDFCVAINDPKAAGSGMFFLSFIFLLIPFNVLDCGFYLLL